MIGWFKQDQCKTPKRLSELFMVEIMDVKINRTETHAAFLRTNIHENLRWEH